MTDDDVTWAASLMERRRRTYAQYSPVFWRPRVGAAARHAKYLGRVARGTDAVALRSANGFLIAIPQGGQYFVDDFAVESDEDWKTDGVDLVVAAWRRIAPVAGAIRIVTARRDRHKRSMLSSLGLSVRERWWVKELQPTAPPHPPGPVDLGGTPAVLVTAPPVYDPGGPVCNVPDTPLTNIEVLWERAAGFGAVLIVIPRIGGELPPPEAEPELEAAGFHNPSEFFEGRPAVD